MPPAQLIPHGTLDYAEVATLGYKPEELLVFSSNINPYGPPPAVVTALSAALTPETIARYPDRLSLDLRARLAAHHAVPEDAILVGNGTADILWLIGLLHLQGRRVAIFSPTFGEYENIATLMNAAISPISHPGWMQLPTGDYQPGPFNVEQSAAALQAAQPEVVFLCNPNNPTGYWLNRNALEALVAATPQALWILDEAYLEFMAQPESTLDCIEQGNWLVLRSMTKDFSLGGLRLGYVIGSPALIAPLQAAQPPWNVNVLAQLAGIACLDALAWRDKTLAQLRTEGELLRQSLQVVDYAPLSTTVNYFLTPVADPATLRQALFARRMVVRDCTSFGLPGYIRLATQRPEHNRLLVTALAELTKTEAPGAGPSSSTDAPEAA
jgi:histidinol-phosphate aminotransferase